MSGIKGKGPIIDPGLCRCCGAMKKCRLLNVEYEFLGKSEIYSEIFVDCFGLVLSNLDGEENNRLICATCVVRLRDASAFRAQVLECEQRLLRETIYVHGTGIAEANIEIKQEDSKAKDEDIADQQIALHDYKGDDENDDDHHVYDSAVDDGNDAVKPKFLEPPHNDATEPRRLRKRTAKTPDESPKKQMLLKLKKMKSKLNDLQVDINQDEQKLQPILPRRLLTADKELNALRNAITIVETSYVCPFATVFSDYHCVYCREMFIDPHMLREHCLTHDPSTYKLVVDPKKPIQIDINRIDCRLCPMLIDNIATLKTHITSVHGKKVHTDVASEFMAFKLKTGTLTCLECDKTFSFFHALKKHMAEHFGAYICDECGAHYFEERHLVLHKNSHNSSKEVQMFSCSDCDKTFRSKSSRNYHVARIHKNEAMYMCNKCDEVFISYYMRYRHKTEVHGERRHFNCESCDKVFDSRKTLREHNQKAHIKLLRHECKLCDKKFYLPSALRDHMTSHTGERNFRCEFCGKNYPRAKALKVHMQSHSAEKKFKCSLCPRAYTQVTNYKNHMKSKHPMPQVDEGYG